MDNVHVTPSSCSKQLYTIRHRKRLAIVNDLFPSSFKDPFKDPSSTTARPNRPPIPTSLLAWTLLPVSQARDPTADHTGTAIGSVALITASELPALQDRADPDFHTSSASLVASTTFLSLTVPSLSTSPASPSTATYRSTTLTSISSAFLSTAHTLSTVVVTQLQTSVIILQVPTTVLVGPLDITSASADLTHFTTSARESFSFPLTSLSTIEVFVASVPRSTASLAAPDLQPSSVTDAQRTTSHFTNPIPTSPAIVTSATTTFTTTASANFAPSNHDAHYKTGMAIGISVLGAALLAFLVLGCIYYHKVYRSKSNVRFRGRKISVPRPIPFVDFKSNHLTATFPGTGVMERDHGRHGNNVNNESHEPVFNAFYNGPTLAKSRSALNCVHDVHITRPSSTFTGVDGADEAHDRNIARAFTPSHNLSESETRNSKVPELSDLPDTGKRFSAGPTFQHYVTDSLACPTYTHNSVHQPIPTLGMASSVLGNSPRSSSTMLNAANVFECHVLANSPAGSCAVLSNAGLSEWSKQSNPPSFDHPRSARKNLDTHASARDDAQERNEPRDESREFHQFRAKDNKTASQEFLLFQPKESTGVKAGKFQKSPRPVTPSNFVVGQPVYTQETSRLHDPNDTSAIRAEQERTYRRGALMRLEGTPRLRSPTPLMLLHHHAVERRARANIKEKADQAADAERHAVDTAEQKGLLPPKWLMESYKLLRVPYSRLSAHGDVPCRSSWPMSALERSKIEEIKESKTGMPPVAGRLRVPKCRLSASKIPSASQEAAKAAGRRV